MSDYRLYCLDGAGRFTTVHEIQAQDDEDAVRQARAKLLGVTCELWEHGRLIVKLAPSDES